MRSCAAFNLPKRSPLRSSRQMPHGIVKEQQDLRPRTEVENLLLPRRIRETLERGTPNRLSHEAQSTLEEVAARHLEDVVSLAIDIAHENSSDVVSSSDIEDAARTLGPRRHRSGRLLEATGGLFAGAGLSLFYAAVTAPDPSTLAFSLAAGSATVGSTMIAFAFARSR